MLDNPQRFDDPLATLKAAAANALTDTWTAMPGIIVSFDPVTLLAEVQVGIKSNVTAPDGSKSAIARSLLVDVPVCFPGGGGCTLTFPLADGDECLLIFAARGIDAWVEYGGTQESMPTRRHSMSDAFALVGVRSKARKLPQPAADTTQLRSDDGTTWVEIDPSGQLVNIKAPGGMTIDAPNVNFTGKVHISDDVTVDTKVTATTDVIGGGISLKTHPHSGVQSGGSTSGPPVP